MSGSAAQFGAELDGAWLDATTADEGAIADMYVRGYQLLVGLAAVDAGAHRAGMEPFEGTPPTSTFERDPRRTYPRPGDGLARAVSAGFRIGDYIGYRDAARARGGYQYGVMIQTPAQRPIFGFPAGSRPAISPKAPEGDWGKVYEILDAELPRAREAALREAWAR